MMQLHLPLTLLAESVARTYYEFARLSRFTQWWHWLLLIVVCGLVLSYIGRLYYRDTREVRKGVRWGLLVLRLTAFAALLFYFLDLEKRSEVEKVRPSRVAMLVDTSQSMGLPDSSGSDGQTRIGKLIDTLKQGELLPQLLEKHDVTVYRFDQNASPTEIAAFSKTSRTQTPDQNATDSPLDDLAFARRVYIAAFLLITTGLICFLIQWLAGHRLRGGEGEAYLLLVGALFLICGFLFAGVTNLRYAPHTMAQAFGREPFEQSAAILDDAAQNEQANIALKPADVRWETELTPRGVETRLGEAIQSIIDKERDGPLAGVVIVTDGCQNAGLAPESVVRAVAAAEIKLFPIGMGSEQQPRSLRIVDLELPPRVYPGDRFTITGYLQANGLEGRTVPISLRQLTLDDQPTSIEASRRVQLGKDGEIIPVQFEVTPTDVGRFKWILQADANPGDDLDSRDNTKQGTVQVVERKSRVLLLAGGPTREYRFLRNLLFRDPRTQVDVMLQSAPAGAAQEADEVLLEFPSDRDALFGYDCLVAFDPDWTLLTREQIQLIDEWVAEKAGGLIVIAGPVYTSQWTRGRRSTDDEQKLRIVKDLYPVTFIGRGPTSIQFGRVGSESAWPLQFSDEGQRAQFLWLEDSPTGSLEAWSKFEGVYGYQALKGIKPGAQVYARFSDPDTATQDELPVYMAGQFYGAGRVFYLGSGEMWRLNAQDSRYFESFYTKLIRHVSQGRLLRDSSHGVLLSDNERCSLGDTISLRAALSDEQYRPLTLDSVEAEIVHEDGTRQPLKLRRLTSSERPGMYAAQFTATREGDVRIDLAIPGIEDELLSREIKVRLPALEIENPERNDALLANLAKQTLGSYTVGLGAALGERGAIPVANQIAAKDQVTYLPGTPDRRFDERLMSWLMAFICGSLSLEWLIRRLYRLA